MLFSHAAGERQEHIVERRTPDAEIIEHDPGFVNATRCGQQHIDAWLIADGNGEATVAGINLCLLRAKPFNGHRCSIEVGGVSHLEVKHIAAESFLQFVGRSLGDHLAMVNNHDAVGEFVGLLEILGGEQERGAALHEVTNELPKLNAGPGIEAGGRLIEKEQPRSAEQRCAKVEPTPHTAGIRLHRPVGGISQRETFKGFGGATASLALRKAVEATYHFQVFPAGEDLVDGGELPGQSNARTNTLGVSHHVDTVHFGRPAVRPQQGRKNPHEGRFACAVRSEQTENRSGGNNQIDAVQGLCVAEGLVNPPNLNHVCAARETVCHIHSLFEDHR